MSGLSAGRWSSYGAIAPPVGPAAGPARHSCPRCENAWRVPQDTGRPAAGFRWTDPDRTDTQQQALEQEGVRFLGDAADASLRLTREELRELLTGGA